NVLFVTEQNTRAIALDTFDALMTNESHNEEALKSFNPAIHAVAEEIRRNGSKWLDELTAAIKYYQVARSAESGDRLKATLKVVDDALLNASKYLAEASKKAKL